MSLQRVLKFLKSELVKVKCPSMPIDFVMEENNEKLTVNFLDYLDDSIDAIYEGNLDDQKFKQIAKVIETYQKILIKLISESNTPIGLYVLALEDLNDELGSIDKKNQGLVTLINLLSEILFEAIPNIEKFTEITNFEKVYMQKYNLHNHNKPKKEEAELMELLQKYMLRNISQEKLFSEYDSLILDSKDKKNIFSMLKPRKYLFGFTTIDDFNKNFQENIKKIATSNKEDNNSIDKKILNFLESPQDDALYRSALELFISMDTNSIAYKTIDDLLKNKKDYDGFNTFHSLEHYITDYINSE